MVGDTGHRVSPRTRQKNKREIPVKPSATCRAAQLLGILTCNRFTGSIACYATGSNGGRYWDRTSDPLRVKQVLYR